MTLSNRFPFCPTCSLETIAKANLGKTVLVVTHGGILNSIFKRIVGQDLTSPRRFGITNAAISQVNSNLLYSQQMNWMWRHVDVIPPSLPCQLRYTKDRGWFIQMWNDTSHLQELGFLHI